MNPARGEAAIGPHGLRPTFAALVAAEGELGPLFALVDRAAAGGLTLGETAALFWHCRVEGGTSREAIGEAMAVAGLAAVAPVLATVLRQILKGR